VRLLVARGVCAAVRPGLGAQQACACARLADPHTGELAIWAPRPACPGRGFAAAAAVQTPAAAASGAAELAAEPGAPGGLSAAAARPNKNRNHARRMLLRQKQIRVRCNLPGQEARVCLVKAGGEQGEGMYEPCMTLLMFQEA